jgi:hypothetical protein
LPKVITRPVPNGTVHKIAYPSRIGDNRIMLEKDPGYIDRLHLVGSAQLIKGWLEGDWTAIEGAFFDCWSEEQHVIRPFSVPREWLRFRSGDWGSVSPFSFGWWQSPAMILCSTVKSSARFRAAPLFVIGNGTALAAS